MSTHSTSKLYLLGHPVRTLAMFWYFQLIEVISSLTPVTTAVPLVGVLSLIAVKDAYDDFVSFTKD